MEIISRTPLTVRTLTRDWLLTRGWLLARSSPFALLSRPPR
ncbi:hypothetical protein [Kitasatospora sp. NPDC092286]